MTDILEAPARTRRSMLRDSRGFCGVGLMRPKTDANVGSALRACGAYGAALMAIQGKRFQKASTDTMKAWRHMPVMETDSMRGALPYGCVPVAIELVPGARSLVGYTHPERAFYIFGPEDGSLGNDVLSWCRDVIYIPTTGCMNLAACVNVVLYDRMAKQVLR